MLENAEIYVCVGRRLSPGNHLERLAYQPERHRNAGDHRRPAYQRPVPSVSIPHRLLSPLPPSSQTFSEALTAA